MTLWIYYTKDVESAYFADIWYDGRVLILIGKKALNSKITLYQPLQKTAAESALTFSSPGR